MLLVSTVLTSMGLTLQEIQHPLIWMEEIAQAVGMSCEDILT
jgi:hypothetical protein